MIIDGVEYVIPQLGKYYILDWGMCYMGNLLWITKATEKWEHTRFDTSRIDNGPDEKKTKSCLFKCVAAIPTSKIHASEPETDIMYSFQLLNDNYMTFSCVALKEATLHEVWT